MHEHAYNVPAGGDHHGYEGPLETHIPALTPQMQSVLIRLANETNTPLYDDLNNGQDLKAGSMARSVKLTPGGPVRQDSFNTFIVPVLSRPNLKVVFGANVLRVEESRSYCRGPRTHEACFGNVVYSKGGRIFNERATKGIILGAGNVNSAKIAALSGIGDCNKLPNCVLNNSQVGQNMKEHFLTSLTFLADYDPLWFGSPGALPVSYAKVNSPNVNTEVVFSTFPYPHPQLGFKQLYLFAISLLENSFTGSVQLKQGQCDDDSVDPHIRFGVQFSATNYMTMAQTIQTVRKVMSESGLNSFELPSMMPQDTAGVMGYLANKNLVPVQHFTGTLSMGKVVDKCGQFYGAKGLYATDASILPQSPNAHATNSAANMAGFIVADALLRGLCDQ
jgi:choline dehydrogenase-like flavoprotein